MNIDWRRLFWFLIGGVWTLPTVVLFILVVGALMPVYVWKRHVRPSPLYTERPTNPLHRDPKLFQFS